MNKKIIGLLAVATICVAAVVAYIYLPLDELWKKKAKEFAQEEAVEVPQFVPISEDQFKTDKPIDISKPDAVILTRSLSQLPQDIISNPFLKDVLSEDFLFYYENNESRLSLEGGIRRIIYEHRQDMLDRILHRIFNSPAEIGIWKGDDGRLTDVIMVMPKTVFSDIAQFALEVSQKDSYVNEFHKVDLNSDELMIWEFRYASNRRFFFTSNQDNLYVFTSPRFFTDKRTTTKTKLKTLLTRNFKDGIFSSTYGLNGIVGKHALLFSVKYLSFGYQKFFPFFQALGFYFDGKQWETWVNTQMVQSESQAAPKVDKITGESTQATDQTQPQQTNPILSSSKVWAAVPGKPAFCSAVPVEPLLLQQMLDMLTGGDKNGAITLKKIKSATAVCWYAKSDVFTPLVVVHTEDLTGQKRFLKNLFNVMIAGGQSISKEGSDKGYLYQKEAWSQHGSEYLVSLGYLDHYLFMSLDGHLVEDAWDTVNKKANSVKDLLSEGKQNISLIISPRQLGDLLRVAVTDTLKTYDETVFLESASSHLFPVFEKLETTQYKTITLTMPQGKTIPGSNWEKLEWSTY